jgi:purine nucleosidase
MKKSFLILLLIQVSLFGQKQKVWLDADTGNEMDDVFAIIRLMWAKDEIDIVGLSSAHFNNADLISFEKWNQYSTAGINPVKISQQLNEEILTTMGLDRIPHPTGADRQMGRAWGGFQPRKSEVTNQLLKVIGSLGVNEKLDILTLGANTNISSLIAIDSTVKSKIRLYSMGLKYDVINKFWSKNDFNSRCDLNGTDFLFNQKNLDWTIITSNTCLPYTYDREEVYSKLDDNNPVEQLMEKRWQETNPQDKTRVLWDMALVQAYLMPQHAEVLELKGPPENGQNPVKIYSKINVEAFRKDFWSEVEKNRNSFSLPNKKPKLGDVHYGNRVGGLIGQEGETKQLIFIDEGDQIQSLRVCLNKDQNIVKGFEINVLKKDNKTVSYTFGNVNNGVWQKEFIVKKGLELIGIKGAAGWFVDRVGFVFSDGSTSPIYGGKGGDNDFTLSITKDGSGRSRGRFMGFWGSSTDYLETIGLVFFPIK